MKSNLTLPILLSAALFAPLALQAQSFLTNGLVAHYPFNGNGDDASGNGNNGVTIGSSDVFAADRRNVASSSLVLSGGTYFNAGVLLSPAAGNYTESCWIKSTQVLETSPTVPGAYRRIVLMTRRTGTGGGDGPGHGGWLEISTSETGQISIRQMDYFYGQGNDITLGRAPLSLNVLDGKWHHLVAVYDYPTNRLFVDGVKVVSYLDTHQMFPSDGTRAFWLGASDALFSNPGDVAPYVGQFDDVRLYNRALPDAQVTTLYSIEKGVPSAAHATATVVNGFVVGATVTDSGFGYTNSPVVLIVGGGGSGATASATIANGIVTGIQIVTAGSGYTGTPTVRVASPPFLARLAIEVSRVNVKLNVVLGRKYQLQSSEDLVQWKNLGEAFVAEQEDLASEFIVEQTGRYFRVQETQ